MGKSFFLVRPSAYWPAIEANRKVINSFTIQHSSPAVQEQSKFVNCGISKGRQNLS